MRRAIALVGLAAAWASSGVSGAPPRASGPVADQLVLAKASTPVVIRDREAGKHTLEAVGQQQQDTAVEPSIAVNPKDPKNAVIGFQAGRVDGGCAQTLGYATTFDGGKTWKTGAVPGVSEASGGTDPLASDPVVAFGPDGTVYFNSLLCATNGNDLGFNVSEDGGKTWGDMIRVPNEQTFPMDDKNWIVVDQGKEDGHHPGRIYLVWDDIAPVLALYSDDKAQTWNGPFVIFEGQGIGTIPLVMPNGDLAVVYNQEANPQPPVPPDSDQAMEVSKQVVSFAPGAGSVPTGGPLAFEPPITIASYEGVDSRQQRAGEGLPTAGVDPKTGRIYVAWSDARFKAADRPVNDIVLTSSDDGVTWTAPTKVNPGRAKSYVEHFTPALAVDDGGGVHISYRTQEQAQTQDDFSPFVDTYYRVSTDGGETFTHRVLVNKTVRSDVRFAAFSRQSAFYGDYSQLGITGSWTYIVRCESYRLKKSENAVFPPEVHHQRAWVAVIDSDGNGKP